MIIREICNPTYTDSVLEKFDYYNNFHDTFVFVRMVMNQTDNLLEKERLQLILEKLQKGNEENVRTSKV